MENEVNIRDYQNKYLEINAELEELQRIANNRPEGLSEELQQKLEDLRAENLSIRMFINNLLEAIRIANLAITARERSKKNVDELEEKLKNAKLNKQQDIEKLVSQLKLAKEILHKDSSDDFNAQDNLWNADFSLKRSMLEESRLRKEIKDLLKTKPQLGGNNNIWKQKYLKYKAKYLKLKI